MMPFVLDLPPIYRGCTWPPIFLNWKNANGDPMTLSGWTPYCTTRHFSLNATVVNPQQGITRIAMSRLQTAPLKLGMEAWDWVWVNHFDTTISVPYLAGRIEIKEPLASVARPLPPP
jgi:hypothetical protein